MELLILSFLAGVLTVAAPCILPLLPVVVGRSVLATDGTKQDSWYRPFVISLSLGVSIIFFTLLLKATTVFLGVPQMFWQTLSGGIIAGFGIYLLWPHGWEVLASKLNLSGRSNQLLGLSRKKQGVAGDALVGFSLGPIFNSCSPTYALIVATILPASFLTGFFYLIAYTVGLCGTLLVIALFGQSATSKLGWLANPSGWFKKTVGIILLVVGLSVLLGLDKRFQAYVLERGWYGPISQLEERFR